MSAGVEAKIARALLRVLGDARAATLVAETARALPEGAWPEEPEAAMDGVRTELLDRVRAETDEATSVAALLEIERALYGRTRHPTPRVSPAVVPESLPPTSGVRAKPQLALLVATRDFGQVSLLSRLMPRGRALLVTKAAALPEHLARPGVVSIVVYDARSPSIDASELEQAMEGTAASLLVWGGELPAGALLRGLGARCARYTTVPATAGATAVLRACLDLVAGAVDAGLG